MNCRFDNLPLSEVFADLGHSPPSNSFLTRDQLDGPEMHYPLKLYVSERTFLVQVAEYKKATEIFTGNYAYFSSFSTTWLNHARAYTQMAATRFGLGRESLVVEVASNDGYLLQYFKQAGVPVLGIEPSGNVAATAQAKGIETKVEFFGERLARSLAAERRQADLIVGNNVFAHVPDLNDFTAGLKIALKPRGVITLEFPHLLRLVEHNQFDTIYHEHFSYFSLHSAALVLQKHGLEVFDVEELPTHGGSLRVFARHAEDDSKPLSPGVARVLADEKARGMTTLDYYRGFQKKVDGVKNAFLGFLLEKKVAGQKVAAYGAAAKGNTLLNYGGVRADLLPFVVDASPHKQGKFLPGSHIPVVDESAIRREQPAFIVILPWNIREEIMHQLAYAREWGARFVVAIPQLTVL
jgi:SAM-dependent methyltransferase